MRAVFVTLSCLCAVLFCASPVLAEEHGGEPVPTLYMAPMPPPMPIALVAAQKAETLQAIAKMRERLAELVPFAPRTDAISQQAADYAEHWTGVVDTFANMQMDAVNTLIVDVNAHHQDQIFDYLHAENLTPPLSLFDDPDFMKMIQTPFDFSNPVPNATGFFGS